MIIDFLAVCDFRVFSGNHHINLSPRPRAGRNRPIVLFGGLNGSGKTSILTALKLALYGKGSLGLVSIADYHAYLSASIHRSNVPMQKATYAFVELGFQYAQHGILSNYRVKRDWTVSHNGKVKEGLQVFRDDRILSELSYDQAQAFLNELIPLGVSELFFFDGEKIKALAEETTGEALKSSIDKLLGLDVITRLDSDLSVLIRTRAEKGMIAEKRQRISVLEQEFKVLKSTIETGIEDLQCQRATLLERTNQLVKTQNEIDSRGGAWSSSRQDESSRLAVLIEKKSIAEAHLRDLSASLLPLAIAQAYLNHTLTVLASEREKRRHYGLAALIRQKRFDFQNAISTLNDNVLAIEAYDSVFSSLLSLQDTTLLHDLSDGKISSIEHRITDSLPSESYRAGVFAAEIEKLNESIDAAGLNLSRAPDDDVLKPLYQKLGIDSERIGESRVKVDLIVEDLRLGSIRLSDIARQLDMHYSDIALSIEKDRIFEYAAKSRELLKEFSFRTIKRKIEELEVRFLESFRRLARKKDIELSIKIDPSTFEVVLQDSDSNTISKNELSAGEKQIYAISILEALARTSGRSLPVIIDTPLGRLDSHHRKNLVDNYFPVASHQVIILSTDTEVDHSFYLDLAPNISHAYRLVFNPETRSSNEEEGYFWNSEATA